jgi:hypothetical protein
MRYFMIIGAACLATACATTSESSDMAIAPGPAPQVVEQGADVRPENDDIVCRIESPTGTRMRERICRTHAEWQAIQESGQETIRHRQTTGYGQY